MRRCAAKPYEGQEKYIFVSYCHRDRAQVFPIVEQLVKDGYRVWYDEGIDPGSEWPEIIAKHLNGCAICLAFITTNSLNSHNCRREINFALLKKKYFISVVLEPVQMSLGMEMQLSSSQSIFKYNLSSDREFFSKLYEAKELEKSKGDPNYSIEVSTPADYMNEAITSDKVRDPFSDRWFAQGGIDEAEKRRKAAEEEAARKAAEEEAARKAAEEEAARTAAEAVCDKTQLGASMIHMFKREKTGEVIRIKKSPFNIGRSSATDDYVIVDNRSVSRGHATVTIKDDVCYVTDNHSLNKTYINGVAATPEQEYALSDGDSVRLYNERFVYTKYQG